MCPQCSLFCPPWLSFGFSLVQFCYLFYSSFVKSCPAFCFVTCLPRCLHLVRTFLTNLNILDICGHLPLLSLIFHGNIIKNSVILDRPTGLYVYFCREISLRKLVEYSNSPCFWPISVPSDMFVYRKYTVINCNPSCRELNESSDGKISDAL